MFSFQGTMKLVGASIAWPFPDSVGVDWLEGPPVPIPNTEVKLKFVYDSMRATACENR